MSSILVETTYKTALSLYYQRFKAFLFYAYVHIHIHKADFNFGFYCQILANRNII